MKIKSHVIIGAVAGGTVGAITSVCNQPKDNQNDFQCLELLKRITIGAILGGVCSMLPDLLEPAKNPHHRELFHSLLALGLTAGVLVKSKNPLFKTAAAGYVSHLIADSLTPMGLPLI